MRLKLTLGHKPGAIIPINYQYELSAWIYKVLSKADGPFAQWLHESGYQLSSGHQQYKLFTFGQIECRPFQINKDDKTISLLNHQSTWKLSFQVNRAIEKFVAGLFRSQHLGLGTSRVRATDFSITAIEILPQPQWNGEMYYRAKSPVVISQQGPEDRYAQFISPEEPDFGQLFINNLLNKYRAFAESRQDEELLNQIHTAPAAAFRLLSDPRSKLVTIKADTENKSEIRGYLFDFALTAPPWLQQFAYHAGFGERNSTGFGYAEIL